MSTSLHCLYCSIPSIPPYRPALCSPNDSVQDYVSLKLLPSFWSPDPFPTLAAHYPPKHPHPFSNNHTTFPNPPLPSFQSLRPKFGSFGSYSHYYSPFQNQLFQYCSRNYYCSQSFAEEASPASGLYCSQTLSQRSIPYWAKSFLRKSSECVLAGVGRYS